QRYVDAYGHLLRNAEAASSAAPATTAATPAATTPASSAATPAANAFLPAAHHAAATHATAHPAPAKLRERHADKGIWDLDRHWLVGRVAHDDPAAFQALRYEGRIDRARLHRVEQVDRLGGSWAGGAFAA